MNRRAVVRGDGITVVLLDPVDPSGGRVVPDLMEEQAKKPKIPEAVNPSLNPRSGERGGTLGH